MSPFHHRSPDAVALPPEKCVVITSGLPRIRYMEFSFTCFSAGQIPATTEPDCPRTTRRNRLARCPLLLALVCAVCMAGCAKTPPSIAWNLGSEGEAMYYFLVQLEAASTNDADAYIDAGKKLLKLEPSEASFMEIADFSMRRKLFEEARITAREGLALFPKSLPLTLVLSDTYIQQERITEAADVLLLYCKTNPDNQDALQELARVYLLGERYEAFDALLATVPVAKMTPYLHYVKARSLLNRNKLTEGEQELRFVVKQAPDMIDAWVNLGIALQLQEKHAEAIPMFRKAVNSDPENLGLWLRLIDAQLRAKRPTQAMQTFAEAPASPVFQKETGIMFVEAKEYALARKIFLQVKDTPGAPEEVHIYLAALALDFLSNPSEALRELAAIPPHSPLAERALRWRLRILEESGRVNEGLPIAKEFAEKNPESAEFHVIYAQSTASSGDTQKAVAMLRAARQKWPENSSVALFLASFLDIKTDRKEALELMEFVIKHQPRNAFALNFVGYMLADDNQELERAHELISRALVEAPEDPHITDSLAWILYRLGNYAEAWTTIQKSVSLGGDHPVIWEHYGDIALKIGNKAEARKGYTNALSTKHEDSEAIRKKIKELP